MRVSYDKDTRKAAKDENKMLYTFQITFPGGSGGITAQGLYSPDTLKQIKSHVDNIFSCIKKESELKNGKETDKA